MIKKSENRFLNSLVQDCITYRLTEPEALDYIQMRYGKQISLAAFNKRKASFRSDSSTQLWLNDFTRVGFVKSHRQHMQRINKICDDSMHQLQLEIHKPVRDERKILALKQDIRESTDMLIELDMGSPVIAAIKARMEQKKNDAQSS